MGSGSILMSEAPNNSISMATSTGNTRNAANTDAKEDNERYGNDTTAVINPSFSVHDSATTTAPTTEVSRLSSQYDTDDSLVNTKPDSILDAWQSTQETSIGHESLRDAHQTSQTSHNKHNPHDRNDDSVHQTLDHEVNHPHEQGHGHGHGHDEATEKLPFYSPPRQRQRWGDTQIAPHTNWGDIFFDLFYVAAAYNLGTILSTDPTPTGLLYTAALFFPVMNLWTFKTYYDSRFYHKDDIWHRGYEITLLLALASAILHIKPVQILSQPTLYKDTFLFCLGLTTAYFLAIGRLLEVIVCHRFFKNQTGLHPEAYVAALHDFGSFVGTGILYAAAAVYAGWVFYHSTSTETPLSSTVMDDSYRTLRTLADAAATPYTAADVVANRPVEMNNVAIWILLAGSVKNVATYVVRVIMKLMSKVDLKAKSVPINVDFIIHRYGEWIMLMLGESVLSMLVVDIVDTAGYYKVFLCSIVSIIMGQYLHFQSAPSDPDQHAIRRSIVASFIYYWLFQVYSLALIVLGVSYKMSLLEVVLAEAKDDDYDRRSLFSTGETVSLRILAATVNPALGLSTAVRQQHIAHLFSGSLSIIFACSDAMSLTHRGVRTQIQRCECANTTFKKGLLTVLVICRVVLIIFIATLSQVVKDPSIVVVIGMFTVMAQVGIRLVGSYVFHNEEERELKALERAINYTRARIHDRPEYSDSVRIPSER